MVAELVALCLVRVDGLEFYLVTGLVAVAVGLVATAATLAVVLVVVILDSRVPYKFDVTKIDIQIKPAMKSPPVTGFSHITAFPKIPRNFLSSRSPARYLRCAPRIAR